MAGPASSGSPGRWPDRQYWPDRIPMSDRSRSGNTRAGTALQTRFDIARSSYSESCVVYRNGSPRFQSSSVQWVHVRIDLLDQRRCPHRIAFGNGDQPQLVHGERYLSATQRPPEVIQLLEGQRIQLQRESHTEQVGVRTECAVRRCAVRERIFALQELYDIRNALQCKNVFVAPIVAGEQHIEVQKYGRILVNGIGWRAVPDSGLVLQRTLLFHIDHGDHDVIGQLVAVAGLQHPDIIGDDGCRRVFKRQVVLQLLLEQRDGCVNHGSDCTITNLKNEMLIRAASPSCHYCINRVGKGEMQTFTMQALKF